MSSYHSEVELNSSTLSIQISPEKGIRLESMSISKRGGKPKSKQAIILDLRVAPADHIEPSPLNIDIPWRKGDPAKVEINITEVYEIEQETISLDVKRSSSRKKTPNSLSTHTKMNVQNNKGRTRGLTPVGEGTGKVMSRNRKPILEDE